MRALFGLIAAIVVFGGVDEKVQVSRLGWERLALVAAGLGLAIGILVVVGNLLQEPRSAEAQPAATKGDPAREAARKPGAAQVITARQAIMPDPEKRDRSRPGDDSPRQAAIVGLLAQGLAGAACRPPIRAA